MSTIKTGTTLTTAYQVVGDTTGSFVVQTGATPTTAMTIDSSQNVVLAKGITVGATAAPAFSAYQSSAQTLSSATQTKIQFQTEEFDTNSNFDSTTNYRFTPTVAGYYQFNAGIEVGVAPSGMFISFFKNGTEVKRGNNIQTPYGFGVTASALIYCNGSTDYVETYGYFAVGQAMATGIQQTYFQGFLARSA